MRRRDIALTDRVAVVLLLALTACSKDAPSTLEPRGPGAARIEGLWWILFWVAMVVFLVVLGLLTVAVMRGIRSAPATRATWGEPFIVIAGVIVPSLILTAVFVVSLGDMNALSERRSDARMTIEVIAHDWWWEARYPGGAVTANEIHVPVGEPVEIELRSADVIHSFWVPRLQAKVDNVPGRVNSLWLEATEPGRYRGQCAEFCGLQHANMLFYVVADAPDRFQEWLENEAAPAAAAPGSLAEGEEVFMTSTCVGCHAIDGTPADASVGPDLTHLASRATIAAGILENTRSNLELFILDPQRVKPGVAMPPTELSASELDALLDFLESLE